jgi:phospholipid/cholesterol/gamma-HCH transport system ATP-binding protein
MSGPVSGPPAAPLVELRDVWKSFGGKPVVRGMDLEVAAGEILFVIGTSGVGKSVAIKLLVGLLPIDRGEIRYAGRRIDGLPERDLFPLRKEIGMVFQNATLFDSLTLRENVALPLRKHKGLRHRDALEAAGARLAQVHMLEHAERFPAELSDGMRKRAAIARTLTLDPRVVLFDEPTTGLDPVSARRIDRLIVELEQAGVTSIVVSHDLVSIFAIAHRIAFVYQGRVHAVGTPAEFRASPDPVIQQFIHGRSQGEMETPGF